jgi:hypothetical protein
MSNRWNVRIRQWRTTNMGDDDYGSPVVSGVSIRDNIVGRFAEDRPNTMLLQQGVETVRTATLEIHAPDILLTLEESDQFEIIFPEYHEYYGERWRMIAKTTPQTPQGRVQGKHYQLKVVHIDTNRTTQV